MPTVDGIAPSGLGMYATCWWFSACLGRLRPALVGSCSIGSSIPTSAENAESGDLAAPARLEQRRTFPCYGSCGRYGVGHTRGARPGNGVAQPNRADTTVKGSATPTSGLGVPMRLVGRVDGPAGKPACLSARPLSTTHIP